MSQYPKLVTASENSVIIYFSEQPNATTSNKIAYVVETLKNQLSNQLIDLVPCYASLLVIYNSTTSNYQRIEAQIHSAIDSWQPNPDKQTARQIELPIYYSRESGPDLERVADHNGLSIEQVIATHQQTQYTAYALGFAPGFAYLGELDSTIATPRLATPRYRVPAGAVAIADRQTAIYPAPSPGGWNLIGLCPTPLFNIDRQPSSVIQVGDSLSFKAISREQFLELGGCESDLGEQP